MPAVRRLTEQGQERKQQLLDCAARLFSERGYAATRVADVCEEAGVAKGLFYWYFENKEALFVELVEQMRRNLRRAQQRAMDRDADPLTRLRQGAEASVRFMCEHAAFFAMEQHDREVARLMRHGSDVHVADTVPLVKAAMDAGQIPDGDDPALVALGIAATVTFFGHLHRSGRVALSVDELAEFVGRWVIGSVAGQP